MLTDDKKYKKDNEEKEPDIKPDPETLHTTDPQEHMQGPVSSLMQKGKKAIEEDGAKQADEDEDED